MRIRSTKPEFWRSKTIAQIDWSTRLVLKGLESYVDDNGVGKDDLALIAADVFPRDLSRDPRETLARLSEAISTLSEAGLIVRYVFDGEDLLYIDKWSDIQRIDKPGKGRFPRPDGTFEYSEPVNRDHYRNIRDTLANIPETLAPVTGEQRNRGTEEQVLASQAPPAPKRGQRIRDDWEPSKATKSWTAENYGHLDLRAECTAFVNYWRGESGQRSRKLDWDAAFKNWLHNARAPARNGHTVPPAKRKVNAGLQLAEKLGQNTPALEA
jgi:hypothetical protein